MVLQSRPRVFSLSVIVQLCGVVHHGGRFGVHFRVSLDSSSAVTSSSGPMIVTFLVWSSPAPLPCLSEDLSVLTFQCSVIVRDFALWRVDRATHGLPSQRPQCTVGVLARTHWGDDSSWVMSHHSANPLWSWS